MKRFEARLSGSGGQGIILAGIILAEAAGVQEGKQVVQTQSYGPESRGSACKCDVVISDSEVKYPGVRQMDLLVCLTQDACDRYAKDLKPDGVLIYDPLLVKRLPEGLARAYPVEATRIAEEMGRKIAANMVALGGVAALGGAAGKDALEAAVLARSPRGSEESNRQAFLAGYATAQQARSDAL